MVDVCVACDNFGLQELQRQQMTTDYDLTMAAQERLADLYQPGELVELLGLDLWDIMDVIWDAVLRSPEILESIGFENDLS